ncbi:MAG: glycosyltransferase family 39 protein [bacterium]
MVKRKFLIIIIFVISILTRLILFYLVYDPDWCGGLVREYRVIAENVLDGHGFSMEIEDKYVPKIVHPPGYSLFLATIFALFGRSDFPVRAIQILIDSLSVILIFLIVERIFGGFTALIAALIACLYPFSVIMSFMLLPATVALFISILAAYFYTKNELKLSDYIISSILFGLAALFRSQLIVVPFFISLGFILGKGIKRGIKPLMYILIPAFLVISPWTIRNWRHFHKFVPLSIGLGWSMWVGIGEDFPTSGAPRNDGELAESEHYDSCTYPFPIERDRARVKKSLNFIKTQPFQYVQVMIKRLFRLLMGFNVPVKPIFRFFIRFIKFFLIFLGTLGMIFSLKRRELLPLIILPWGLALCLIPMHVEGRYFLPSIFPFFIFAAETVKIGLNRFMKLQVEKGEK